MKKFVLVLLVTTPFTVARAQDTKPEIVTDRPDQTEAPVLVPKGGLQVELGTSMENDKVDGAKVINYTYATALIKYGINENFELRLINEFLGERTRFT